jgi:hypothetical protein
MKHAGAAEAAIWRENSRLRWLFHALQGEGNPTVTILESLARAFRRSPIDLLSDSGKTYPVAPSVEIPAVQEAPPMR